jgi:hypothetical protein
MYRLQRTLLGRAHPHGLPLGAAAADTMCGDSEGQAGSAVV